MVDRLLKALGIIWSVVAFGLATAFFLGGQWNDWNEVRKRVLENPNSINILIYVTLF